MEILTSTKDIARLYTQNEIRSLIDLLTSMLKTGLAEGHTDWWDSVEHMGPREDGTEFLDVHFDAETEPGKTTVTLYGLKYAGPDVTSYVEDIPQTNLDDGMDFGDLIALIELPS